MNKPFVINLGGASYAEGPAGKHGQVFELLMCQRVCCPDCGDVDPDLLREWDREHREGVFCCPTCGRPVLARGGWMAEQDG